MSCADQRITAPGSIEANLHVAIAFYTTRIRSYSHNFWIPSHSHHQLKSISIMNDLLYDCVFAVVSILYRMIY